MFGGAQDSSRAALVPTASSERQAELYRDENARRVRDGRLAAETFCLVVADSGGRIGSGGATIHALGKLAEETGGSESWWSQHRVWMIHSGGESRRLPQYAPLGKLFGLLPAGHGGGETTTVFDEMLALSTAWIERMPPGLLVSSGDVIPRFDPDQVDWSRPGVTGVAMRLPVEIGRRHGVYVSDERGRVYSFPQKPSAEEIAAASGRGGAADCAVDTGLLRLDAGTAARLAAVAGLETPPAMDLYEHIPKALTAQWKPEPGAEAFWRLLAECLPGLPFHCSVVEGEFVHVGATRGFRSVAATAGGLLDSAIAGPSEIGPEAVALECALEGPVRASRGAVLHGLTGLRGSVEVPADTVLHQLPVRTGVRPGIKECDSAIRVYGVEDDPKEPLERATWFGRPLGEALQALGLSAAEVWRETSEPPSLWNADLFPAGSVEDAWECAKGMRGLDSRYGPVEWRGARRISPAESSKWADGEMLAELRSRRMRAQWQRTVLDLAHSGADLRPMLANAPGLPAIAAAGWMLRERAGEIAASDPARGGGIEGSQGCPPLTRAASLFVQAGTVSGPWQVARRKGRRGRLAPHRLRGRVKRHAAVLSGLGRPGGQYRVGGKRRVPHRNHRAAPARAPDPVRCGGNRRGGRVPDVRGTAGSDAAGFAVYHSPNRASNARCAARRRARYPLSREAAGGQRSGDQQHPGRDGDPGPG